MLPDINLLPKYERQSSITYILFIVGLVIVILLMIVFLFLYIDKRGTLENTNESLNQLNQDKAALQEQLTILETGNDTQNIDNIIKYVESHIIPTSAFIDELITLLPENSYLSNYNYSYQSVDIETHFETMQSAAVYISELNHSAYVKDVKVNQMNTFELGTQEVEEDMSIEDFYNTIPRYFVSYSIEVNQAYLREAGEKDE